MSIQYRSIKNNTYTSMIHILLKKIVKYFICILYIIIYNISNEYKKVDTF
jgi:hypothetical protein